MWTVYKADGRVADFFPPDHMAELLHMKQIEGGEAMRMCILESEHMQQIIDILKEVPDTDLRWVGPAW